MLEARYEVYVGWVYTHDGTGAKEAFKRRGESNLVGVYNTLDEAKEVYCRIVPRVKLCSSGCFMHKVKWLQNVTVIQEDFPEEP